MVGGSIFLKIKRNGVLENSFLCSVGFPENIFRHTLEKNMKAGGIKMNKKMGCILAFCTALGLAACSSTDGEGGDMGGEQ